MKQNRKVQDMVEVAVLLAVMLVLSFTPLGYIPLPGLSITTMHIPVIIGACLLGPRVGGILGFFFGITSVIHATVQPGLMSFMFSPFYSLDNGQAANWASLIVAIVPRIAIGVVAGYVFKWIAKSGKHVSLALVSAGVLGSMTNTIGVMYLIYLFFAAPYAAVLHLSQDTLLAVIGSVVLTNGIGEAVVAGLVTLVVCRSLFTALHRKAVRA